MNKEKIKKILSDKRTRIILVCVAALLLLLIVWKVFFGNRGTAVSGSYQPTEREARLSTILSQIDGVKGATVMITEEAGEAVSAVIVFEGEDGILVRMRVLDVASNALNLKKEKILVYPAAEK